MEAWTFPFYCSSPCCRRHNRMCMAFPLQVTSSPLSFMVFLCHFLLFISHSFHHFSSISSSSSMRWKDVWPMHSYKIEGIIHLQEAWDLRPQIGHHMWNFAQTKCLCRGLWCLRRQFSMSGVIPESLHVQEILSQVVNFRPRRSEVCKPVIHILC